MKQYVVLRWFKIILLSGFITSCESVTLSAVCLCPEALGCITTGSSVEHTSQDGNGEQENNRENGKSSGKWEGGNCVSEIVSCQ